MTIIIFLLFISLSAALLFLFGFFWAVKTGQYEDDYTPAMRILLDDSAPSENEPPVISK